MVAFRNVVQSLDKAKTITHVARPLKDMSKYHVLEDEDAKK